MFEPAPVRRSRRGQTKETAKRTELQLLQHIATLTTMADLDILKAQMEAEMIPKTKAVKKALDEQEDIIAKEQEDDVASPSEVAAQGRRLKRELRKLGTKPMTTSLFFGPATRRKSRGRMAMEAVENAEFEKAIAAENALIQAEANAAAEAAAAPALSPFVPIATPDNAIMNSLTERFGRANLGPRIGAPNGRNPFTRNAMRSRGVPGYHFSGEGGSRRRPRKTRKSRSKSRR